MKAEEEDTASLSNGKNKGKRDDEGNQPLFLRKVL